MKKILYLVLAYIILIIIINLAGFAGSEDKEMLEFALKYFDISQIREGRSYFIYAIIPITIYRILVVSLILFIIIRGYYSSVEQWIKNKIKNEFLRLLVSFLFIFLILSLIRLPFNIFIGFYRSHLFGMSKIDFNTWFIRYLGSASISLALYSISFAILSFVIIKVKRYMLLIPLVVLVLSISISIIYPRFITPLFYETEKITDTELKHKIDNLLNKAGIKISDIRIIKKGKYHSAVNAYLVGFGNDRKIFLYDTLVKKFNHDEILSVLAHEIVHYKEEHMLIGILLASVGIVLGILLIGKLSILIFGLDIKRLFDVNGHPSFLVLMILVIFVSQPADNFISRIIERRADVKSFSLIHNSKTFINMKVRMAKINKSDVLSHPLYSWFYFTHPGTLERIKTANEYFRNKD